MIRAREAGPLVPIPQDAVDRLYDRYQNVYGQQGDARRAGTTKTPARAKTTRRTTKVGS